jgi:hypothetical protein
MDANKDQPQNSQPKQRSSDSIAPGLFLWSGLCLLLFIVFFVTSYDIRPGDILAGKSPGGFSLTPQAASRVFYLQFFS